MSGGSGNSLQGYGSGLYGNPPIESLPLGYYLGLITSLYRNSPNFITFLKAILQKLDDASQLFVSMDTAWDVDNAVGPQLDQIGGIVGASRTVPFQPTGGLNPTLGDSDYRVYIKARAAQNTWDGHIDSLYGIWQTLFPGGKIVIADNQNMTAAIILVGTFTPIMQQLITNGLIVPRPEGVFYYYILQSELPVFAFDQSNAYAAGFDIGFFAEGY